MYPLSVFNESMDKIFKIRDILTLNVAILEQAEAKVTGHGNDALVETICETFWDHLQKYSAKNADEVSLTHLLH